MKKKNLIIALSVAAVLILGGLIVHKYISVPQPLQPTLTDANPAAVSAAGQAGWNETQK